MWKLPSGDFIETILYNRLRNATHECLGHSYIIDTNDPAIEKLFHPSDWDAILTKVSKWPENDIKLLDSMKRFVKVR